MANVKISELTALTTPAAADSLVIVDASEASAEKTKYITWANLVAAITGAAATYTITGAFTASMPTNGVSANAKFMLGNSSTIAWFYLNTAPPGWKVSALAGDSVLAVAGGTRAYNVNGGNLSSPPTWTVGGLTANAHYHAGPSHTHTLTTSDMTQSGAGAVTADAGNQVEISHTHTATSAAGGTGSTGLASATGVTSDETWRPQAYVGKLFQLDTA